MRFHNREEAGRMLAEKLSGYRNDPTALILALPRGGVAVGYQLSLALHLPLDVFITRKIGAPGNPEYAIGAVAETGSHYLNQEAINSFGIPRHELERLIHVQEQEIARRKDLYRQGRSLPLLTGRTVLLVDDGIATGSTFMASACVIRHLQPRRLVGVIPVGPPSTIHEVRSQVDELVILMTPDPFDAVGNFFVDFTQVEDRDVLEYLHLSEESMLAHMLSSPTP
ncbi:MAG: phosphoribosyltransferase [Nitrospirota bacterium]|nr:phosphoribosyltransferase [Nitrospirota bacterium]MDP2382052.1 phosphoribosyltransferase [Nitrospirota bacterium]MDP3599493.1 phosphoribosyltransferase [Nitrospirota bacterium]